MRGARVLTSTAMLAAGTIAWSLIEAHRFILRRRTLAVLPPGAPPLRLLLLSDLHMTPTQRDKQSWLRDLARLEPDLTIVTGDFLADRHAIPAALAALAPLGQFPGAFVLGSNDYFAPTPINPIHYLRGPSSPRPHRPPLPWGDLVAGLTAWGWQDLTTRQWQTTLGDSPSGPVNVTLRGIDDPHIMLDRYEQVAGPFPDTDLRLGVVHAPYLRVLNALAADDADAIIAGHTHGGQLCWPGGRPIVTNCDLPPQYARHLKQYVPQQAQIARANGTDGWWGPDPKDITNHPALHVCAGLGTSPKAPVRFACRPEAVLLTLTA